MKNWKPWEHLHTRDHDGSDELKDMMNFTNSNAFPATFERYDNMKHSPNERRPSAAIHPEEKL